MKKDFHNCTIALSLKGKLSKKIKGRKWQVCTDDQRSDHRRLNLSVNNINHHGSLFTETVCKAVQIQLGQGIGSNLNRNSR